MLYLTILLFLFFIFPLSHSRVDKQGSVCTIVPSSDGGDDSSSIISAFQQCNKDASVVFQNKTYHVERTMVTHGLQNVSVDVQGTLLWGTNITYWRNNSIPLGYLNMTSAWDFSGSNIHWDGHGFGTFDGNGQLWYDFSNNTSNLPGRPINFVIRNTTDSVFEGMRFVQSQFWTMVVHSSSNIILQDFYINSTSNSTGTTQNTDGIDTFYTDNLTIRRWTVINGDDAVAPKANTSNLLVQDSHFIDGFSVAIGSIGQYEGVYEFIENVTAERIVCDRCLYVGYVKTWTGLQQGFPPNGGGGGLGFARNVVFRDFIVTNLTSSVAEISQCTSYEGATGGCDTSTFQISNVTWENITGSVATDTLAALQCSGSAPCPGIAIKNVDVSFGEGGGNVVDCSNVVDPQGFECTAGS
ncbi:pectin lyase fold/virulence factor [Amylostereum chailletii]|nr:pectin lyase fold/virulence factor [Amylostereum chailletii]